MVSKLNMLPQRIKRNWTHWATWNSKLKILSNMFQRVPSERVSNASRRALTCTVHNPVWNAFRNFFWNALEPVLEYSGTRLTEKNVLYTDAFQTRSDHEVRLKRTSNFADDTAYCVFYEVPSPLSAFPSCMYVCDFSIMCGMGLVDVCCAGT